VAHTLSIRVATQADVALMAVIHAAAFSTAESWSGDVFSLHLALPNVIGLLYGQDGFILVRVAGGEAEILTLAVTPPARRRGIATALLDTAVSTVAQAGANVLFLEVSVKNTAGRALYLTQGFIQAGLRPRYYSDRSDALVLRRDLIDPP
jgi:ribosomal-protein-alanine N-acetyltransferase